MSGKSLAGLPCAQFAGQQVLHALDELTFALFFNNSLMMVRNASSIENLISSFGVYLGSLAAERSYSSLFSRDR